VLHRKSNHADAQSDLTAHTASDSMNVILTHNDRQAVDFLLSGETSAKENGLPPEISERVIHTRKLLHLLDWLPTQEPPANLTESTLRRIAVHKGSSRHPEV